MKLKFETSHEIKFRATGDNGRGWEVSAFVQPHITINCPALLDWLKEKFNLTEVDNEPVETKP